MQSVKQSGCLQSQGQFVKQMALDIALDASVEAGMSVSKKQEEYARQPVSPSVSRWSEKARKSSAGSESVIALQ